MAVPKTLFPLVLLGLIAFGLQLTTVIYPGMVRMIQYSGSDAQGQAMGGPYPPMPHSVAKREASETDSEDQDEMTDSQDHPNMPDDDDSSSPVPDDDDTSSPEPDDDDTSSPEPSPPPHPQPGPHPNPPHPPVPEPHGHHVHPHHRRHHNHSRNCSREAEASGIADLFREMDALVSSSGQQQEIIETLDIGMIFSRYCYAVRGSKKGNCKAARTELLLRGLGYTDKPDNDALREIKPEPIPEHVFRNLPAHRGLAFTAVGLTLIGIIAGFLGFRKEDACRCFRVASMIAMLLSTIFLAIPVARLARLNAEFPGRHSSTQDGPDLQHPVSIMVGGVSLVLTLICGLLSLFGVMRSRRSTNWNKFYNPSTPPTEKKMSDLAFYAEPLPDKVSLHFTPSVCEQDIVPPYLADCQEKKPLE